MTKSETILTDSRTEDADASDMREPTELDPSELEAVRRLCERSGSGAIAW
jgi:hypothetical protein